MGLALVASASLATACFDPDLEYVDGAGQAGAWTEMPWGTATLPVENAFLTGSMGDVRDFEGTPQVSAFSDPWYSSVSITVDDRSAGAAMTMFNINGELENIRQYAGHTVVFQGGYYGLEVDEGGDDGDEVPVEPDDELFVDVIGCSGDDPGMWDYDVPADEVEVTVTADEEDPDLYHVDFEATFGTQGGDRPGVVNGGFSVDLADLPEPADLPGNPIGPDAGW